MNSDVFVTRQCRLFEVLEWSTAICLAQHYGDLKRHYPLGSTEYLEIIDVFMPVRQLRSIKPDRNINGQHTLLFVSLL